MPTPPAILNKIKLLINLATSPNQNEAEAAQAMAEKLIAKYNVTPEELAATEAKVYYGEDEKLFVTVGGVVGWKQQLSLAIATYFDCQIVQEEVIQLDNSHIFTYFVYGDEDQVKDTQFVYHAFSKKVNALLDTKCLGRGRIYQDSYSEGVVESIKLNIRMFGIDIPEIKKPTFTKEEVKVGPTNAMTFSPTKEEPTDQRVNIAAGTLIKDIMAYFKGVDDGKDLSLKDILDLEVKNKEAEQLKEKVEDDGNVQ